MSQGGGTLLVAAGVRTLDADGPRPPRAVLVEGERISWVGADPRDAPPHARALDLAGAWLAPAFVDAHVHLTAFGLTHSGLDLAGAASLAEALTRLRTHAARTDGPVTGHGWDESAWPEQRAPRSDELADAAPGRTVHLARVDGHSGVVDPATLAALPLDRLEGVHRAGDGRPTGWLAEQANEAAWQEVRAQLPEARLAAARTAAAEHAAGLGITTVHEMGHPALSSLDDARAWRDGDWPVESLVWWADIDARVALDAGLRPGGDLFLDGSIGSGTAAVDGTDTHPFHDDAAVTDVLVTATERGTTAAAHAIGERAIAQFARALDAAARRCGARAVAACGHRLEHVELPRPADVPVLRRYGVVASVQPAFDARWGGPDGMYAARLGRARALASNPFADLTAAGVPLAFGSDAPVTPLDPWGAVEAATDHRGDRGIPRAAAFAAHTLGGRRAGGQVDIGHVRPGERADLVAWDADPLGTRRPTALATLRAGAVVAGATD